MTYENKPFTILTESWFISDRIKRAILRFGGKILGRKIHGPVAVFDSLVRWLDQINNAKASKSDNSSDIYNYNVNPPINQIHETVIVLMLKDTLRYALELKKQWKIKYIYAGPAISVPLDKDDIFFDQWIDKIVVPSQRVANYFKSICPESADRILIWPAGVCDTWISQKRNNKLLIYKKTCPEDIYIWVTEILKAKNIPFDVIEYGKFDFDIYMDKLDKCVGIVYLQESESQWLALQEAWIKDIPTLVRNRWFWKYQTAYREDRKISAPYLTDHCGIFFSDQKDFENKVDIFINNIDNYQARKYCIVNLSDIQTTKLLLNFINNKKHVKIP